MKMHEKWKNVDLPETPLISLPPYCVYGNALRPHIVQFGESIDPEILSAAFSVSRQAELFFVVEISGVVSPASQMPLLTLENGAKIVEINPPTVLTPYMSLSIRGKAEVLPRFWKELSRS